MRLPCEQIAGHLKRELQPLYTVFGTEPLLALEASDSIRAKARAEGYTERDTLNPVVRMRLSSTKTQPTKARSQVIRSDTA